MPISYLNGVLPLGKVDLPLPLLLGLLVDLVLGHTAADGAGVLGPEVEREVLLVLVEQTELRALVEVDDGKGTSDGLADVLAVRGVSILFKSGITTLFCICIPCIQPIPLVLFCIPSLSFYCCRRNRLGGGGSQNFHFQGLPRTFSESSTRHHQQSSGHGAG